jgi:hypothetical protein
MEKQERVRAYVSGLDAKDHGSALRGTNLTRAEPGRDTVFILFRRGNSIEDSLHYRARIISIVGQALRQNNDCPKIQEYGIWFGVLITSGR